MKVVAYGNSTGFTVFHNIGSGIDCDNTTFGGDPKGGSFKACFIRGDEPSAGYSFCAAENEVCSFDGEMDVAFGADGAFYYEYGVSGGVDCDVDEFGDPNYGTAKACYIQPSSHRPVARLLAPRDIATEFGLNPPQRRLEAKLPSRRR